MFSGLKGDTRPLETFNIPPAILGKLLGAGFQRVGDVLNLQPSELADEAGLGLDEAVLILMQVRDKQTSSRPSNKRTALELLSVEDQNGVLTLNRELDEMLGRGVALGKTTEFCGAPGMGKTQLGIQLAVDVHLPEYFDGVHGHCIYIDTEGSFMPGRAAEIANALVRKVQDLYVAHKEGMTPEECAKVDALTVESILSSIYYFRVHNYVEQIALIHVLRDKILKQMPLVKLVVIDSIAFHFRCSFDDYAMRTRLLGNMSQALIQIAKELNIAVVLMNQITTKIGADGKTELVPALGETWGHTSTNRIMLYEKGGVRYARLLKSPNRQKAEVPYQVTEEGIRSVSAEDLHHHDHDHDHEEEEEE